MSADASALRASRTLSSELACKLVWPSGQQAIMVLSLILARLRSNKCTQLVIGHEQVVAFSKCFKRLKFSSWVWTALCKFAIHVWCFVYFSLGLQVWSSCNLVVFFVDCCGLTLCSGPSIGRWTTFSQPDFSPHRMPLPLDSLPHPPFSTPPP